MSNINFNDPKFNNISKEKKILLSQLIQELQTMPSSNSIGYLMALNSKLKSQGIKFTDSEMNILYEALASNMTSKDKQKFSLLKRLIR